MKRQAVVVNAEGRLMAEILRSEACAQCRACRYGQEKRMLVPLPEGDFQPGDMVELELPEASFSKASLLAYAFPLAMFLAGLLGASLFTRSEAIMALAAFAALGVSLLLLRLMEPRLRRNGKYMPAARKCAAAIPKKTSEEES